MKINKKHIKFLKEYEKLCKKYNMGLIGCGCCESPYLLDYSIEKEGDFVDDLENINFVDGCVYIEPMFKEKMKLKEFEEKIEGGLK